MQKVTIRKIEARDEAAWRKHWAGYCKFYEVTLSQATTDHTWKRIMDAASPVHAIVAEDATHGVTGICNYIIHENTWEIKPVCYLEDLFVDPALRAAGTGEAMIDWLKDEMARANWSRIYWNTKENNYRARGLYDKFTPRDPFVRYVIKAPAA
jgi:GNAT superfamily N-acetyltransferase